MDLDTNEELTEIPGADDEIEPQPVAADPFNGLGSIIEAVTTKACDRIEDCLADRGQSSTESWDIAKSGSWLARRQIARTSFAGNLSHRSALGGVFGVSGGNLSLRTMARIVALRAAKQASDLVGSEPFMQAMPAKMTDKENAKIAKQTEAKVQEEIAKSNARMALAESIRVALNEGDRAIKITYEKDVTSYIDSAEVAIGPDGMPIKTPKGQYIYRKDDQLQMVVDAEGNVLRRVQTNEDGQPIEQLQPGEAVQIRLKKEPAFIISTDLNFQMVEGLQLTITHRDGLHFAGLFAEDFIYPIHVPSLDDPSCDIMVHRYDAPLESIAHQYENSGYVDERKTLVAGSPQSTAGSPIDSAGEHQRSIQNQEVITFYETYFRTWITPEKEGSKPIESWLFIVIDWVTKRPVFANYLGRMKMKRPPFFLLRGLESEPGRAYGVGIYEKFYDRDLMIDVWFNRAAQKSSRTNSITCAHADGLEELLQNRQVAFGTDKLYKIPAGSEYGKDRPPVFRINLSEMTDPEFELFRELVSGGEAEFGVVDPTGNNTQSARGEQVATAVRNIERTGNTLNESSEAMQAMDITKGLEIAVDTIFENMDTDEMIWVPGEEMLATLNRDEIRNLDRNVRLLVTKAKGSDTIEISTAAANTIEKYYTFGAQMRKDTRDQYVEILKSLNVADSDDKLREPTDEEIAAEAQAKAPAPPPSETMNMRLADIGELTPDERAQVLSKFGITASPPENVIAMRDAAKQEEANKMALKGKHDPIFAGSMIPGADAA